MSKVLDIEVVSIIFDIMSNKLAMVDEPGPGLTFREKSLWVQIASTVVIYAYYFWRAVAIGETDPGQVGVLFGVVVVVMVAVQAVVHAALVRHRRPEVADERDRRIAVKAARNAYYVLMTGVWGALGLIALTAKPFWVAHAALLAIIVAELVRFASQLVYYRRGA